MSMDFCSWCVGSVEASRLTGQGKSGGVCAEHKAEYLRQLKEAIERKRNGKLENNS